MKRHCKPLFIFIINQETTNEKFVCFRHSVAKQASSKKRKWPAKENHRTPNSKQACGGRQPCKTLLRSTLWRHRTRWPQPPVISVLKFAAACCLRSLWGFSYPSHDLQRQTCDSERLWVESAKQPGKMETSRPIKRGKKTPSQQALGKKLRKLSLCSRTAAAHGQKACCLISSSKCIRGKKTDLIALLSSMTGRYNCISGSLTGQTQNSVTLTASWWWLCFVHIVIGRRSALIAGNDRL